MCFCALFLFTNVAVCALFTKRTLNMKIITWNVNGIRSLKKPLSCILKELDGDVSCFQETKISRSQLFESTALIDGYTSYFSYPRKQSGYSGVATYCKDIFMPDDAEEGLSGILSGKTDDCLLSNFQLLNDSAFDLSELDSEGRVITTYHLIKFDDELRHLAIINIYCPRVDPDKPERHLYKMQFCHLLEAKARKLCEDGCFVMIVGDMNISRSIIDHCDPGDENEFNASEARQWFKSFLSSKIGYCNGDVFMVDAFRHMYPDRRNAYTCWNTKIGARLTNFGTRIDYILISSNLVPLLLNCDLITDYEGSDHCPVFAELKFDAVSTDTVSVPSICTKLWPEFFGKQQTLQKFLKKTQDLADNLTKSTHLNVTSVNKKTASDRSNKQKSIKSFFKSSLIEEKNQSKNSKCSDIECKNEKLTVVNGDIVNCSQNSNNSDNDESVVSSSPKNSSQVSEWKSVLKGPPKPPVCSGHKKPCALRTVKKKGPNFGRQFFMCAQPAGHASNPEANCNFFKWVSAAKMSTLK